MFTSSAHYFNLWFILGSFVGATLTWIWEENLKTGFCLDRHFRGSSIFRLSVECSSQFKKKSENSFQLSTHVIFLGYAWIANCETTVAASLYAIVLSNGYKRSYMQILIKTITVLFT